MKKAILYSRVSSDEQAKGGSLKYQEDALRRYCESNGIEVVDVYREDYSAKTFNRPDMNTICKKYLHKHKEVDADALLVLRWNRFTREASEGWEYISKFKKYGIEVNAVEEHLDFNVSESKIMLSVYLTMAEVDNDKRSTATKDGIHQALKEGKCAGLAPYGYVNKREGKHNSWIEFDPVEAPLVQEAFRRVAYGVEAPTLVWKDLKRKGMKASKSTFFRMLEKRFYAGDVFVPAYGDEPPVFVKGVFEPMVDRKTFETVQRKLKGTIEQVATVKKIPDDVFFMRTFMRCPVCGNPVYGSFSQGRTKRYAYYHCNYCGKFRISAEEANDSMYKYLSSIKPNEAVMALYEAILLDIQKENSIASLEEKQRLNKSLEDIEKRIKKVQEKWFEGVLDDDIFTNMNARLMAEKKELELKIDTNKEQPSTREMNEKLKYALAFIENMGYCVANSPIDLKLNILGSIFNEKIVFENSKPRTTELSPLVSLIAGKPSNCKGTKTKKPSDNSVGFSRGG